MATEVRLPCQGNSVESSLIVAWRKQQGDQVVEGDVICEVETEKAVFEIPAPVSGTVLATFYELGDDVPVLKTIAVIGEPGEDISAFSPDSVSQAMLDTATPVTNSEEIIDKQSVAPLVSEERTPNSTAPGISPRALKRAWEKGVDVITLTGTGPNGRVIERDVLAVHGTKPPSDPSPSSTITPINGDYQDIAVNGIRKVTASRMMQSLQTTAQLTLHASADMTSVNGLRAQLKKSSDMDEAAITINDLLLFAVSRVLPRHPQINAHFLGEKIHQYQQVHLGLAVDTPRGLMVPVIKLADTLSLTALSREAKRLASACLDGSIKPGELTGGTFTVTNLGQLGIESFTPVLNAPQVGILGVCAPTLRPIQQSSGVAFEPHIGLSLTFDHQALDGAAAARFLNDLVRVIADLEQLPVCVAQSV